MRKGLYAASVVAMCAAASASLANAQETSGTVAASPAVEEQSFGDIIVTAQRRQERNQDVPISITAFSADRLDQQNITTAQDLNGSVPSLQVGAVGQASRDTEAFTLRGQAPTYQGAAAVVSYLSEVPLIQAFTTSQQGGPGNFMDLENVQVLAGPQGTLFGRNTTGGAVLLVPHKPTNEFGGYVEASAGNYDYRGVEAVLNVPLIEDKLLVRFAGTFQDRDGFTQDLTWGKDRDDRHYYAGRVGITFKPSDRFENYLLAFGAKSDTNGTAYVHRGFNLGFLQQQGLCSDAPACSVFTRQTDLANQIGPRQVRSGVDAFENLGTWGVINKTTFRLTDELTINNIASYQRYRKDYEYDADGTPMQIADIGTSRYPTFPVAGLSDEFGIAPNGYTSVARSAPRDNLKQFTEEFQLQGSLLDKKLSFTVGAFYYDQRPASDQLNNAIYQCSDYPTMFNAGTGNCSPTYQFYGVANTSKALYGQATLDLGAFTPSLDNLRLTGGYRYTWDKTEGTSTFYLPFGPSTFYCISGGTLSSNTAGCSYNATLKSNAPTWTLGLDYKVNSRVMMFGKVSRGYKAGGFNPFSVRPTTRTFDPEYVTSYEAGFKSDWRFGTVPFRLNVTGYSMDYDDIQRSIGDVNPDSAAGGSRTEKAQARIRGIEVESMVRPIPALEIGGNLGYTDAKWKDFRYVVSGETVGCNGTIPANGTVDLTCTDFGVPKWIYSVHASLDLPTPEDWGRISLFANYSHISSANTTLLPAGSENLQPGSVFDSYGLLNLSASWKNIAQSNLDLELFMTNVTNKLYKISNSNYFAGGYWSEIYGEPRMYGMRLRYRFGD